MIWTFLWKNKAWLLLAVVVVVAGLFICSQRADIALKTADITLKESTIAKQQSQIDTLARQNQIMTQNAQAAAAAQKQMQLIQKEAEPLRELTANIPQKAKDCLNNEEIDHVNYCLGAFFRDGVLPKDCTSAAVLPKATAAGVESGRR